MTDIYDDVMPYMPSYEINGRKLAMLRATRLNLASQICLFPTHGFDPGENPNRFRILLRFLLNECEISDVYLASFVKVRIDKVRRWHTKSPILRGSRRDYIFNMAQILMFEIEAYSNGEASPQWLFQKELNDNNPVNADLF